jgi:3-oxoacyl-[acyl-carrier protein] reductase
MPDGSGLVTGATRGIGRGIAERLAERGYSLTVAARDIDRLRETAEWLRSAGAPQVVTVAGDLADPDHVVELADAHATAYGSMSCLVLNAGVGTAGPIGELSTHRLDKTIAVNLRAPFVLAQRCLPLLRLAAADDPERGARVVALASISGVYAEAGLAAYGATKAAVISLVETLNAEESRHGVTATAIAPGYVETDMSAWVLDQVPAQEMIPVADIVDLVDAVIGLSARSVVSRLVVARAGAPAYGA